MAMNIAAVRAGVKAALGGIDGLTVYSYRAFRPELDAVVIDPTTINPNFVFGPRHWDHEFTLTLLVGGADDAAADERQGGYLAEDGSQSTSILVAVEVDKTFGGACQDSNVVEINEFGWREFADGAVTALGCNITFRVIT